MDIPVKGTLTLHQPQTYGLYILCGLVPLVPGGTPITTIRRHKLTSNVVKTAAEFLDLVAGVQPSIPKHIPAEQCVHAVATGMQLTNTSVLSH